MASSNNQHGQDNDETNGPIKKMPPTNKPRKPRRKKRPEGTRAPNGAGSIYYSEADGKWHGRVIVGVKDDGTPDRRHVQRKTEAEVVKAVQALIAARDSGDVLAPGKPPTVAGWLTTWIEDIVPRTAKPSTLAGYRTNVYKHLIPGLGAHRMHRTKPDHFEKLYSKIEQSGLSMYTVLQVHRTARAAWNEAIRRGVVKPPNPVSLAKWGRLDEEEREPFEPDEIRRIIAAALRRRNGVRFVIALALGNRQGEALGIKWERLNGRRKSLRFPKQLQRGRWLHGCDDPRVCAAAHHKTEPCPQPCSRHKRAESCKPCPLDCVGHARHCAKRHGGGLVEVSVKSRAGKREIILPALLWDMIDAHKKVQDAEREFAGTVWSEGGWMFTQPDGKPIDPKADRAEWREVLAEAGVREARLHDARHTAATVLALLEVAPREAMDFMGWSSDAMRLRYQHVTDAMKQRTAQRLNSFLLGDEASQGDGN